ncbi:LysR family transcriptional regulator [Paenibacillus flagellatus]|uniref:LysR family transcriptional regulator n=1 Tax=Paenibacillus flagellatus TaxID=2211139 RepID=A0A2V5K0S1_9BACL|nr:LysR family transcriptional regulator [Paenibacillus flagellatus]PYI52172.1 LysR family transcriptional regulator [Paenibacillus flagellatus]
MELTDLKVFAAVAEEGSISRAAERLEYVQSNVTARIRKLESELGVPLFRRHPKGVELTEKGKAFREYAVLIVKLSEEAANAVKETDVPSGPLAVGVVETVTCGNFMNALAEFQTRYPDVSLSLVTGTSSELLAQVLDRRLDGAFVTGDVDSPKIVREYMERDEIVLLSGGDPTEPPDLANVRWAVSPVGCPFRGVLERWLREEGVPFRNKIEIGSLETLLNSVKAGLACTVQPKSVLTGAYDGLIAYPLPEKFRYAETSLIRRDDPLPNRAFAAFAVMVRSRGL